MSALCQKQTYAVQHKGLFNHLVSAQQERGRQAKPKRLGRHEIDNRIEFGRRSTSLQAKERERQKSLQR
jgi:hypothetical protein